MDGNYDVIRDGKVIGVAVLQRQGLYFRIRCRCRLEGSAVQRLTLCVGDWETDLGVLVPMAGEFGLDTRIVAKRLPSGEPEFLVGKRREETAPPAEEPAMETMPSPQEAEEAAAQMDLPPENSETAAETMDAAEEVLKTAEFPETVMDTECSAPADAPETPSAPIFAAVAEDEPFPQLARVMEAVYEERDGVPGLLLPPEA